MVLKQRHSYRSRTAPLLMFLLAASFLAINLWAASPLLITTASAAARPNVYTVANVSVDAIASNAVAAKKQAQNEGKIKALQQLFKRLVKYTDYPRLPKVDLPTAEALLDMIVVLKEGNSRIRYKAVLTYRFHKTAVKQLLQRAGVAFIDHQAPPMVLVASVTEMTPPASDTETKPPPTGHGVPPITPQPSQPQPDVGTTPAMLNLQPVSGAELERNQLLQNWYQALRALDLRNALTPIKLAPIAPPTSQNAGTYNGSGGHAGRQGASRPHRLVKAQLTKPSGSGKLLLTLQGRDAVGPFANRQSFPIFDNDVKAALAKAATVTLKILEGRWKTSRLGFGDDDAARASAQAARSHDRFTMTARFSGLREWITIRRKLQSISGIYDMQAGAVSPRGASISLTYPGGPEQLAAELAGSPFSLRNEAGQWVLQRQ